MENRGKDSLSKVLYRAENAVASSDLDGSLVAEGRSTRDHIERPFRVFDEVEDRKWVALVAALAGERVSPTLFPFSFFFWLHFTADPRGDRAPGRGALWEELVRLLHIPAYRQYETSAVILWGKRKAKRGA